MSCLFLVDVFILFLRSLLALNTSLFRPSCIALMPAIVKNLASAQCTPYHVDYSEPATQCVVVAHYTNIQLKPRIYLMGGFKAMQLGRNSLVFRQSGLGFCVHEVMYRD